MDEGVLERLQKFLGDEEPNMISAISNIASYSLLVVETGAILAP